MMFNNTHLRCSVTDKYCNYKSFIVGNFMVYFHLIFFKTICMPILIIPLTKIDEKLSKESKKVIIPITL